MNINFTEEKYAYIYGLLLTDGYLLENTRNRGKLGIELNIKDADIIYKIAQIFKEYNPKIRKRTRDTNFVKNYSSITLDIFSLELREIFKAAGFPCGKKSIKTKSLDINNKDFWRGVIDGDGSLGFTSKGFPFLSLVTISSELAEDYIKFLYTYTEKLKTTSKNKRDNAFNICIYKEDALKIAEVLYKDSNIFLKRKYDKYIEINKWIRPDSMRKKAS